MIYNANRKPYEVGQNKKVIGWIAFEVIARVMHELRSLSSSQAILMVFSLSL